MTCAITHIGNYANDIIQWFDIFEYVYSEIYPILLANVEFIIIFFGRKMIRAILEYSPFSELCNVIFKYTKTGPVSLFIIRNVMYPYNAFQILKK